MDAIQYAQKYLSPWEPTEFKRIHQAMTLLAFKSDTQCQPYKVKEITPGGSSTRIHACSLENYVLFL